MADSIVGGASSDGRGEDLRAGGTALPSASQAGFDAVLGVWGSWMEMASSSAQAWGGSMAGGGMAGGAGAQPPRPAADPGLPFADRMLQLNALLLHDPVLRSMDELWNANPLRDVVPVDWAGIARALRTVWLGSLHDPDKAAAAAFELNAGVLRSALEAWNDASRRWLAGAGAAPTLTPAGVDKRFSAPEWHSNPVYRTLMESYLLASDWLLRQGEADGLDEAERRRVNFHLRQFVDATSPALSLLSNPVALRRAIETGGASLADGARNLAQDLRDGKLSMVDAAAFEPGRNLALSPGVVVHRNKLIELIQYSPTTETVHRTPVLILPPWINKFYILDLQPRNSMVRYLVEQGFTVFMVSWKNPDAALDGTTIEDYVDLAPIEASDVIREITGSPKVNAMGYCIGGTLLAMTLAWLAAKGDDRFDAATLMVSLQDFSKVGDTAVFVDDPAIDLIEQQMLERGYLDSRTMSNMFNLLRSNDLIWSNVVNNYLLGQKPPAFDLLYWNSDGTRMTRAAHSWYLRNTYRENRLARPGQAVLKGEALDLGRIRLPTFAVGAEKDHIVPWDAAWRVTQLFGGEVRYLLATSGHIAGIINPPGGKGAYWTADSGGQAPDAQAWLRSATRHEGSWWGAWTDWLAEHSGPMAPPPPLGSAAHPALDDAPGRYVLEK